MIGYRGYELSRFLRPLPSLEPETQRSTNFAIFVAYEIDSFQVIGVMTSNVGGMISGDFKNCTYFWHHHGIEGGARIPQMHEIRGVSYSSPPCDSPQGKFYALDHTRPCRCRNTWGNPSKACRCWPLNAQNGIKCLRRGQGVRGVIKVPRKSSRLTFALTLPIRRERWNVILHALVLTGIKKV
jgi:hypothetical protein